MPSDGGLAGRRAGQAPAVMAMQAPHGMQANGGRHKYEVLLVLLLVSMVIQSACIQRHSRPAVGHLPDGVDGDDFRRRVPAHARALLGRCCCSCRPWPSAGCGTTGPQATRGLAMAFNVLISLFLWATVGVILRDLFRTPDPGLQRARCDLRLPDRGRRVVGHQPAGLSAGAGVLWHQPRARTAVGHWHGRLALFCYYSFSQMLTIGYRTSRRCARRPPR